MNYHDAMVWNMSMYPCCKELTWTLNLEFVLPTHRVNLSMISTAGEIWKSPTGSWSKTWNSGRPQGRPTKTCLPSAGRLLAKWLRSHSVCLIYGTLAPFYTIGNCRQCYMQMACNIAEYIPLIPTIYTYCLHCIYEVEPSHNLTFFRGHLLHLTKPQMSSFHSRPRVSKNICRAGLAEVWVYSNILSWCDAEL